MPIANNGLTICYVSSRRDNRIEWFFDSLAKQVVLQAHLIVIDRFAEEPGRKDEIFNKFATAFTVPLYVEHEEKGNVPAKFFTHAEPKPTVWQGPHRLTKEDWFATANARNTALCLCRTSHIAFVDDLSVLMPGWWTSAQEAVAGNYIGCGAYKKVKNLVVKDGEPIGYVETSEGIDDRLRRVSEDVSPCTGGWLYGCSCVFPVEDLLEVGGWPEICDSLGSEDCCLGIALANAGKRLKFDRRMLTLESDELHFVEPPMKRTDKGVSPNDKSHAVLEIAKQSTYFPNYYEGGIRALRDYVLAGNPCPITQIPTCDWYDNQPISEM